MTQLQTYIGTKIIQARPMMGPAGNLYPDKDGYEVIYPDGYRSWSPKEAFEQAYRLTDSMTFGDALVMLKAGRKVARAGWNGKGMWLKLVPADLGDAVAFQYEALDAAPWIGMKTADQKFVPWLASQTDMLADDWRVVE